MFKIISESSVSAGVRRIEAVTGKKVYDLLVNQKNIIDDTAQFLNTRPNQIKQRIESLEEEIQNQKEEIKRLRSSSIKDIYKDLESNIVKKDDHNSVVYKFKNTSIGELRDYENRLKNSYDNLIIVFASVSDEKIVFTVSVDDNLTDKYNAGNIVREISQITGGNGGGRRNFAQAGGKDISKLDSALEKAFEII